ncbi:bifunctional riboflavin kinase/FAD synthetase [Aquibacillus albus]|uniref:Riboflavin biosynthesis protein n=1 Tax=Aquibacillus albus TaxID=1168171 RepID=A0ABS2N1T1_9BACI|nr:bifunctional riboflavin kinase/FAD synthetase [Aquibacillus albus]MBM7572069.1 riboflavin kinase/FMN adenylyltransferase [Aquibacillus albus]
METINLAYPHQFEKNSLPETVAAIGVFDGIHRGHQQVIQTAIDKAKRQDRQSAVITFYPHPSVVLKQEKEKVSYLTPLREKTEILKSMGVDKLYIITFNKELSKLQPQMFIDHFLIGLNIKHLVAGFDFTYGHMGKGTMETINQYTRGEFNHTTVNKLEENDQKISSTLIREKLVDGEVEVANHLLGRPHTIRGIVIEGDKRGRTIGFPTANIKLSDDFFLPRTGVYAVTIKHNRQLFKGMANVGYKPTFESKSDRPSIEVNIFDYNQDIYGEELVIEWRSYIREEKKFNGIEQLVAQIKQDEKTIRTFFHVNRV